MNASEAQIVELAAGSSSKRSTCATVRPRPSPGGLPLRQAFAPQPFPSRSSPTRSKWTSESRETRSCLPMRKARSWRRSIIRRTVVSETRSVVLTSFRVSSDGTTENVESLPVYLRFAPPPAMTGGVSHARRGASTTTSSRDGHGGLHLGERGHLAQPPLRPLRPHSEAPRLNATTFLGRSSSDFI